MSFHLSAQNIRVEDDHILHAELQNEDGDWVEAELDLNHVLGNNDGRFEWHGGDFSGSADDISFELEGDDNVPILRAQLTNGDGDQVDADVNLAERIGNNNGSFHFE
ncbi:Cyanovirin-N [Aspergillus karnatakaensis]|uniref:CVNH domain-containing protein n=1 Tax=Aspergillus karnatakaensis TaxID=1810916 RepID=UPI003CCDF04E